MSESNVIIRDLRPCDRAAWDPLWQGYLTFYKSAVSDAVSDATFARLTGPDAQMQGLAACLGDGRLVGFAHVIMHPSTWNPAGYCYLEDLFVAPDVRGGGHARALIEEVYRRADAAGVGRVYWSTQEHNARARALYDKLAAKSEFVQYRR